MKNTDKVATKPAQTLFRTLSKNNYILQEMIDRKANIIITTNAIIISVLLGSSFFQETNAYVHQGFLLLLLSIWGTSIMLALYAIKPFLINKQNKQQPLNKLLNYHMVKDSDIDTFKNKVFETLHNESSIYESMVQDIYQVGKNIKTKHYYLDLAAYFFILGIILSVLAFAILLF